MQQTCFTEMESPSLELTNGAVQNRMRTPSTARPPPLGSTARLPCLGACPTLLAQFYISTVFNHCQRMHGLKLDAPFDSTETAAAAYLPLPGLPRHGPLRTQ